MRCGKTELEQEMEVKQEAEFRQITRKNTRHYESKAANEVVKGTQQDSSGKTWDESRSVSSSHNMKE